MESRLLVVSSQKSTHVSNYNVVLREINIMLLINVTPMEKKQNEKATHRRKTICSVFRTGLVSKLCRELLQLINKKRNTNNFKMSKIYEWILHKIRYKYG